MIQTFIDYPLLLLFTVAALGYLFGSIKFKGSSLGVAAVLFTGLGFGALDPHLQIPEIIFLLGLSLFVYSIGLSSGPAFFASYKRNGVRDFLFILLMLVFSGILAGVLWIFTDFSAATITGIYAGSTTNTAALAGVIDYINSLGGAETSKVVQDAVVGYSFSYPMGVLGGIIAILIMEKWFNISYEEEKKALKKDYPLESRLFTATVEITHAHITGIPFRNLRKQYDWNVSFGRFYRNKIPQLISWSTIFEIGDVVMIVGSKDDLQQVVDALGVKHKGNFERDNTVYDARRIFVSNPDMAGKTIASLNLEAQYDATITRIRRGDVDMLAKPDTVLEIGDRVRFTAHKDELDELSELFGDSYTESSKVNLFSFGLGIGLGLLLGSFEITLGVGLSFKLGYAGGPLIVGLLLGALRRTGPIVWALPYSANVTLQQIGLILLLTAIGVRSGNAFVQSLSIEGLWIFLAGSAISLLTAVSILWVGYKLMKMPFSLLMGVVANQPAILDFATSRTKNSIPVFGYAMMFPIALITKIVIAQVLFLILT